MFIFLLIMIIVLFSSGIEKDLSDVENLLYFNEEDSNKENKPKPRKPKEEEMELMDLLDDELVNEDKITNDARSLLEEINGQ